MSSLYRIKCPACQKVVDIPSNQKCTCGADLILPTDGMIQFHRLGSLNGCAVPLRIYLNEISLGHLFNNQTASIPVPYGHYKLRATCGMSKSSVYFEFDITPQDRCAYFTGLNRKGFFGFYLELNKVTENKFPK